MFAVRFEEAPLKILYGDSFERSLYDIRRLLKEEKIEGKTSSLTLYFHLSNIVTSIYYVFPKFTLPIMMVKY